MRAANYSLRGKPLPSATVAKSSKLPVLRCSFSFILLFAVGFLWFVSQNVQIINNNPRMGTTNENAPLRQGDSTDKKWSPPSSRKQDNTMKFMKIPTPVFVASLPKSGTTSTWKYFLCGLGQGQAAHQWASVSNGTQQIRLGKCWHQNMEQKRPLLEGCGGYKVWTDVGFLAPGVCFYPSIHGGLEALYRDYPQATLLNVVRETESWVNSTTQFNDLWARWSDKCYKFPGPGSSRQDYNDFYDWHTSMVRQFAKDHPSMTYVEVKLEGEDTGKIMEEKTGINASCWIHSRTKKGKRGRKKMQNQQSQ